MYLNSKDLRDLFPGERTLLLERGGSDCLTGWTRLRDAPLPYTTHLLYVCLPGEAPAGGGYLPGMQLLRLTGGDADLEALGEEVPDTVHALLVESGDLQAVCTALQRYFDTECRLGLFSADLLDLLSAEAGIQAMVDRAYRAFSNPITVFDPGFNLIATNWEDQTQMDFASELLQNRRFTDREFEMANRDHNYKQVQKSEVPIQAYNPAIGLDQLLCAIDTQKDLGHIVVTAANRPLDLMDHRLLQILKKCIAQQMKKDEFVRNMQGFHYEYFLRDLLDERIATSRAFRDSLSYSNQDFRGDMCCLVVETARSPSTVNIYRVRSALEVHFPRCKVLMYNGQIVGVLSLSEAQLRSKSYVEAAVRLCMEQGLYAGLSNCFQNIVELSEYYKQALRAIELGACRENGPGLFAYEDYYLDHVRNIFTQKEEASTFCHPKMRLLLEYDEKHDAELAYTLYSYLTHERSIAHTAAAMHMHRNSVVYRIKRIHALIGSDFERYAQRQYLILSYEWMRGGPRA